MTADLNLESSHFKQMPWRSIAAAVALTTVCNVLIALTGVGQGSSEEIVPRGWEWVDSIVGFVWVGLITAQAIAWTKLRRSPIVEFRWFATQVLWLIAACLCYPFTFGLTPMGGLLGNVLIGMWAATLTWKISRKSWTQAGLIAPTALWLLVATIYLTKLIGANPVYLKV